MSTLTKKYKLSFVVRFLKDRISSTVFTKEMLDSEAAQFCEPSKPVEMKRIIDFHEADPRCSVLFDDRYDFSVLCSLTVDFIQYRQQVTRRRLRLRLHPYCCTYRHHLYTLQRRTGSTVKSWLRLLSVHLINNVVACLHCYQTRTR